VDTLVAISIAVVTFVTMLPMSIYSGRVLLQVRVMWSVMVVAQKMSYFNDMQGLELHKL
jgi:hypothetical protein